MRPRYYKLNKPRNVVSQFISPDKVGLLGDIHFSFPPGTHALGRLDNDSEGLLLLTTNKKITRLLFLAKKNHLRTYLVMVQNVVSEKTLAALKSGVSIFIKNGITYLAKPDHIEIVVTPIELCKQAHDIREQYPHTWLLITLTEGKHRQVRKMVLAAKHRCLRLIRISMAGISLGDLQPGHVEELDEETFCSLTEINL